MNNWLKPVSFAEDAEKTRIANILRIILLSIAGFSILIAFAIPLSRADFTFSLRFSLIPLTILIHLYYWHLVRSGHVYRVSWMFIITSYLLGTIGIITKPTTLLNPHISIYFVVIILSAALFTQRKVTLFFTVLTSISSIVIYVAHTSGVIGVQHTTITPDNFEFVGFIFYFLLITFLLNVTSKTISTNLHIIQQQNAEFVEQNQQLKKLQDDLEWQVSMRVTQMTQTLADLEKKRDLLETQLWFSQGQTQLEQALRELPTHKTPYQLIIQQVCRHLATPFGTIFLANEQQLEQKADVGLESSTIVPQTFAMGEGLVGQVAQAQKVYQINQLPIGYCASNTKPTAQQNLFIQPLLYNQQVQGVVELIRKQPYSQRELEWLEHVSYTIGGAIHQLKTQNRLIAIHEEAK